MTQASGHNMAVMSQVTHRTFLSMEVNKNTHMALGLLNPDRGYKVQLQPSFQHVNLALGLDLEEKSKKEKKKLNMANS